MPYHCMANRWGSHGDGDRLYFLGSKITADSDCSHRFKKHLLLGRKAMKKPRQCINNQRHHFTDKGLYSKSYGFSSGHVWM